MPNTKRYFYSFFFTSCLYGLFFIGIYYSWDSIFVKNKIKEKTINLNFVSLVEQKKIVKKEPLVKKEVIKKVTEKKIIKEITIEKVIKKQVVKKQKKEVIKRVVKENIIKKKPEKIEKEFVKKEQEFMQKSIKRSYEEDFLNEHLKLIVKLIQQNIKYPKRAKRLNIQGSVLVKFKILTTGEVKDIESISGHRLLIKSSIDAIEKASKNFPKVKKEILIKVPIQYTLT